MPIKWSALQVNEAMDMLEECVNETIEPLGRTKIIVAEALKIPNIPQYITERLFSLNTSIRRIEDIGYSIKAVRESLPAGAVEEEKKRLISGKQMSLVI